MRERAASPPREDVFRLHQRPDWLVVTPRAAGPSGGMRAIVPAVRLDSAGDETRLVWDDGPAAVGEPLTGVWDFLALADASDADILEYARRHGVLGLHADASAAGSEPIATWRAYARGLAALLAIAAALRHDRPTRVDEWPAAAEAAVTLAEPAALSGDYRQRLAETFAGLALYGVLDTNEPFNGPQMQRRLFERLMTDLLGSSRLRSTMAVDDEGRSRLGLALPSISTHSPRGTDTAARVDRLADLLLAAACEAMQADDLELCSVCGRAYRRPADAMRARTDRRSFCSDACRREAKREVQRESARRRMAERRTMEAGSNVKIGR